MSLYLIDRRNADLALDLAKKDENAKIVLIQDGVYLDAAPVKGKKEVYYVKNDVVKRGVEKLPEGAVVIGYDELIDMVEKENVVNFV